MDDSAVKRRRAIARGKGRLAAGEGAALAASLALDLEGSVAPFMNSSRSPLPPRPPLPPLPLPSLLTSPPAKTSAGWACRQFLSSLPSPSFHVLQCSSYVCDSASCLPDGLHLLRLILLVSFQPSIKLNGRFLRSLVKSTGKHYVTPSQPQK